MYKYVEDARYTGVSKNHNKLKTGIFSVVAVSRLLLQTPAKLTRNTHNTNHTHKKIVSRLLMAIPLRSLQARVALSVTGEANAVLGALPIFVTSQKRGAESCGK